MIESSQARLSGLLKVKDSFTAAWAWTQSEIYVQNVSPEVIALCLSVDLIQLHWQSLTVRALLRLKTRKRLQIQSLALLPVTKSVCSRLYRLGEAWDFPNVSRARHPEHERCRRRRCWEGGAPATERIASHHNHLHCLIFGKGKKVCSICFI